MEGFILIGKKADIPQGRGKRFNIKGNSIVVFNIDGEFYAFDDFCKGGADMAKAVVTVDGDVLCPYHGWRFDIKEGICTMVPDCQIKKYNLKIKQDEIYIEIK